MSREHIDAIQKDWVSAERDFDEHARKIVKNWDDLNMADAIKGWVGDCTGFAHKANELANHLLNLGHNPRKGSGTPTTAQNEGNLMGERISWCLRVKDQLQTKTQNENRRSVAKQPFQIDMLRGKIIPLTKEAIFNLIALAQIKDLCTGISITEPEMPILRPDGVKLHSYRTVEFTLHLTVQTCNAKIFFQSAIERVIRNSTFTSLENLQFNLVYDLRSDEVTTYDGARVRVKLLELGAKTPEQIQRV